MRTRHTIDGLDQELFDAILRRSLAEAAKEDSGWVCTEDGDVYWIAAESKYVARAQMASEINEPKTSISVRKVYLRVDYDAIEDLARDMATVGNAVSVIGEERRSYLLKTATAETWGDGGYLWTECKRTDERATPFWRCEWNGA